MSLAERLARIRHRPSVMPRPSAREHTLGAVRTRDGGERERCFGPRSACSSSRPLAPGGDVDAHRRRRRTTSASVMRLPPATRCVCSTAATANGWRGSSRSARAACRAARRGACSRAQTAGAGPVALLRADQEGPDRRWWSRRRPSSASSGCCRCSPAIPSPARVNLERLRGAGHRGGRAMRAADAFRRWPTVTPWSGWSSQWPARAAPAGHGRARRRPADRRGRCRRIHDDADDRCTVAPGILIGPEGGFAADDDDGAARRQAVRRTRQPRPAHPARRDRRRRGACMLAGFARRLAPHARQQRAEIGTSSGCPDQASEPRSRRPTSAG